MSSGLSVEAKPFMTGLLRLPSLNSVSCLTRYSGCWPWRMGLAGLPREPSAVWQAAQTWVEIAWPLARSGLAGAGASAAIAGTTVHAARAASIREAIDFMWEEESLLAWSKTQRFYNGAHHGRPSTSQRPGAHPQEARDAGENGTGLGTYGALPHHRQPTASVARHRAARDRLRRALQRGQIHCHQHAHATAAARLRLQEAGAHAAHQPVRGGSQAGGRRA